MGHRRGCLHAVGPLALLPLLICQVAPLARPACPLAGVCRGPLWPHGHVPAGPGGGADSAVGRQAGGGTRAARAVPAAGLTCPEHQAGRRCGPYRQGDARDDRACPLPRRRRWRGGCAGTCGRTPCGCRGAPPLACLGGPGDAPLPLWGHRCSDTRGTCPETSPLALLPLRHSPTLPLAHARRPKPFPSCSPRPPTGWKQPPRQRRCTRAGRAQAAPRPLLEQGAQWQHGRWEPPPAGQAARSAWGQVRLRVAQGRRRRRPTLSQARLA